MNESRTRDKGTRTLTRTRTSLKISYTDSLSNLDGLICWFGCFMGLYGLGGRLSYLVGRVHEPFRNIPVLICRWWSGLRSFKCVKNVSSNNFNFFFRFRTDFMVSEMWSIDVATYNHSIVAPPICYFNDEVLLFQKHIVLAIVISPKIIFPRNDRPNWKICSCRGRFQLVDLSELRIDTQRQNHKSFSLMNLKKLQKN